MKGNDLGFPGNKNQNILAGEVLGAGGGVGVGGWGIVSDTNPALELSGAE